MLTFNLQRLVSTRYRGPATRREKTKTKTLQFTLDSMRNNTLDFIKRLPYTQGVDKYVTKGLSLGTRPFFSLVPIDYTGLLWGSRKCPVIGYSTHNFMEFHNMMTSNAPRFIYLVATEGLENTPSWICVINGTVSPTVV